MSILIERVKANFILSTDKDDDLLKEFINDAVSYAESYQKKQLDIILKNLCLPQLSKL